MYKFLIYPYWNVNLYFDFTVATRPRFLIYPYWNVNLLNLVVGSIKDKFLIYPYWNVNFLAVNYDVAKRRVSNLSILECKLRKDDDTKEVNSCF